MRIRTLNLTLWHKSGKLEKDHYLGADLNVQARALLTARPGRTSVPLSTININEPPKTMWLKLLPRLGKEYDTSNRGELEICIGYSQEGNSNTKVRAAQTYQPSITLLSQSRPPDSPKKPAPSTAPAATVCMAVLMGAPMQRSRANRQRPWPARRKSRPRPGSNRPQCKSARVDVDIDD